jgi:hypothetical protein
VVAADAEQDPRVTGVRAPSDSPLKLLQDDVCGQFVDATRAARHREFGVAGSRGGRDGGERLELARPGRVSRQQADLQLCQIVRRKRPACGQILWHSAGWQTDQREVGAVGEPQHETLVDQWGQPADQSTAVGADDDMDARAGAVAQQVEHAVYGAPAADILERGDKRLPAVDEDGDVRQRRATSGTLLLDRSESLCGEFGASRRQLRDQ